MWQIAIAGAVAVAVPTAVVLWVIRRRLLVVDVSGNSMLPTLRPGDRVLGLRRRPAARLRRGDLVVCNLPLPSGDRTPALIVKRVAALPGDPVPEGGGEVVPRDHIWVRGDGAESYDSAQFGALARSEVVARVVARMHGG